MLSEERTACLDILNMDLKKGDELKFRLYDGEIIEGRFFRYIYKGFVVKNKGEFKRVRCLDVEYFIV
jgi:hypothetical protein